MMFYLSNVAIAVNISQPSVRIGGGLHALIHIYFLHGGSKSAKPHWDLKKTMKNYVIERSQAIEGQALCDSFKVPMRFGAFRPPE